MGYGFSWVEDLSFLWLWLKEKEGLEGLDALPNFAGRLWGFGTCGVGDKSVRPDAAGMK